MFSPPKPFESNGGYMMPSTNDEGDAIEWIEERLCCRRDGARAKMRRNLARFAEHVQVVFAVE